MKSRSDKVVRNPTVNPRDPDAFFPWLARLVGRGAIPCESVDYDALGSLTFRFDYRGQPLRILWRVADSADDWTRAVCLPTGTEEGMSPTLAANLRQQIVARLSALLQRRGPLPLLERRNREHTELRWAADTLDALCPDLLRPGKTRVSGFLFEGSSWRDGVHSLQFVRAGHSVQLVLSDTNRDGELLGKFGPLYLYGSDEKSDASDLAAVARYVGYALALSIHGGMGLVSTAQSESDIQQEPVDPRVPAGERTNPFFRHEYYACGMVISAMFTSPSRVLPIFHGNRECAAFASYLTGMTETAYLHQKGMRPHHDFLRRVRTVDTNEIEAIMSGSQDDLTALLTEAVEQGDPDLVVVMGTCVSSILGDSLERSIHDAGLRERGVRTIGFETTASELDQHHQVFWSTLIGMFEGPRNGDPSPGVNLLGYGHASDQVLQELKDLLQRMGIRRCASLIPSFDIANLSTLSHADLNLLYPAPLVRESVQAARSKLRAPVAEIPPPFGIRGTVHWLKTLASSLGCEQEAEMVVRELLEVWNPRFQSLAERSKAIRLAMVLTSNHPYEHEPMRRFGVPVFDLLAEMGIDLHIFVIPSPHPSKHGEPLRPQELCSMRGLITSHPSARLTFVQDLHELQRSVERSACQLLYTEIPGDRRATCVGAVPISHLDFEMGLAGACRSLSKFQEAAQMPFYRRYGRYLPCSPWSLP